MFRYLANQFTGNPPPPEPAAAADIVLTQARPSVLASYLEAVWANRAAGVELGVAAGPPEVYHESHARPAAWDFVAGFPLPGIWHHLVYAYLLEATNIVDVFRRVVFEFAHGERLPLPSQPVQWWARVTEELFFMPPNPYWVFGVTSEVRPDAGAVRRNAYYRLLGWELPTPGARAGGFVKADTANREFTPIFESLLKEVWRAYTNRSNFLNENQTDRGGIELLVQRLAEMLRTRRFQGLLSREEFNAVALLSWLHLTVDTDNIVVTTLSGQAQSAAERLRRIGERAGVPVHSRADAFFRMAEPMSIVLRAIENGAIPPNAPGILWTGGLITQAMLTIITNWPLATGRPIKDARPAMPVSGMAATTLMGNGAMTAPLVPR